MPIIGMTDADTSMPRFPLLGVLRKGAARPEGGGRPGKDLEWFRFDPRRQEIGEAFEQAYGTQPDSLTVFLPYALISDCFPTWREEWVAGGLVHRCDGETCSLWRNAQGRYSREPKPCTYAAKEEKGCKPVGRLNLILPDLLRAGFVGYVSLGTSSINDIVSIHSSLLAVAEARGSEDLRGIAFQLYRQKESISTPGKDGQRMRREVSLVKLVPSAEWVRSQIAASARDALALPDVDVSTGELLSAPDEEEADDVSDALALQQEQIDTGRVPQGDPMAPQQEPKPAEAWVDEFITKAVRHYSQANPDIAEPQVLKALHMTRADFVAAYTAGKIKAQALKATLDDAFSEQVSF